MLTDSPVYFKDLPLHIQQSVPPHLRLYIWDNKEPRIGACDERLVRHLFFDKVTIINNIRELHGDSTLNIQVWFSGEKHKYGQNYCNNFESMLIEYIDEEIKIPFTLDELRLCRVLTLPDPNMWAATTVYTRKEKFNNGVELNDTTRLE